MAIANGTCVSFCNQPKAHFGLPLVRPWDNRGKCYMNEKRIQCLSNASQHVPIYLQPFPSNSTRKFKSTFLHVLASSGYAPRTIAVSVTRMERVFNAGQMCYSMCPSIFNRLRAIVRYWSEIATFFYPLAFNVPMGWSHWNSRKNFGLHKTRIMGRALPGSVAVKTV